MSRALVSPPALKRKRPGAGMPVLVDAERAILDLIKSKKDSGIWIRDIKQEIKLPDPVVTKSLKSLLANQLIKEVVNIQNKGTRKKHYMAAEFEPSKELSGGVWYADGSLDKDLINVLKEFSSRYIRVQKVATLEGLHNELKNRRVTTFEISREHVDELLNSMVLDNDIMEVKSTGLGEYHSIPIGKVCYRKASSAAGVAKGPRSSGAFATIPCGACPRISVCRPDGVISPATCEYYAKWLRIDF